MGTYFAVLGARPGSGSVGTLVEMESYSTMDVLASAGAEYNRLVSEVLQFFDQSNDHAGGQVELKKVTEATTYGD